jgi:hypothetical protein
MRSGAPAAHDVSNLCQSQPMIQRRQNSLTNHILCFHLAESRALLAFLIFPYAELTLHKFSIEPTKLTGNSREGKTELRTMPTTYT